MTPRTRAATAETPTASFLLEHLSAVGGLVVDPFLGSGAIAREAFSRGRRFVGCDVNPTAIELARLFVDPPSQASLAAAFRSVQARVREEIERQYRLENGGAASHFLWDDTTLKSVWTKREGRRARVELAPTDHDLALCSLYERYSPTQLRPLRIHHNSRINTRTVTDWRSLFTGRSLRSIELLHGAIGTLDDARVRRALLLVLTASVGQMSKMVFAIERRGKTKGAAETSRVEVGSWVIGFWTPTLRFEVNAWNCFSNKAARLLRGLHDESHGLRPVSLADRPQLVTEGAADVALMDGDARTLAALLPPRSVELIATDPPHGDRIPYLEMSEVWNALLGHQPDFEQELVVSNARERGKDLASYARQLRVTLAAFVPGLTNDGTLAVMFNSRSHAEWATLLDAAEGAGLAYRGRVPMAYSARSVVQDSRAGALEHDFVVLFSRTRSRAMPQRLQALASKLPRWSSARPV